ncbi:MAG: Ig-like domain repeat protein, partial [Acidobacteriaceae bacterium]
MTASFLKDRVCLWLRLGRDLLPRFSTLFAPLLVAAMALPALGQATIQVPANQPTIQSAITAAANGDIVLVSPGTYHENLDFHGKAITVTSVSGPAVTIIDGGASGPVVSFHTGEVRSSIISGFTIRNGGAEPQPSVAGAGGVYINASAPTVSNNIITANACHGVWVSGGAALIQGNEINQTTGANDYCTFSGSGILLIGRGTIPNGSQPALTSNVVIGNTIEQNLTANYYDGGGIFLWAVENSVIESNIIRNNATTGQGGGIVAYNSDAMLIAQNLITGNSAGYGAGGISMLIPESTQGPFIGFIQDNTFAGNTISNPNPNGVYGSQVYIEGNLAQYEFTNNIVLGNSSSPAFMCGTTYDYLSLTPLVADHNDIYNASGPGYGGACPDQSGTYGNIAADPLFDNAANGVYTLQASSPAIDAGNTSALQLIANDGYPLATDLNGKPRLQDATGKGYPIVDMGAYEHAGSQDAQATTVLLTPSAWNVNGGSNLTLSAQLASPAGTPTGAVTFYEDGTQIGTGSIDGTGAATFALTKLVPGPHAFVATYSGDGSFPAAVSVKIYVLVEKYSVTLTLASTPNPSLVNQAVTFTITSNSPDNSHPSPITLTDNGNPLATLTPDSSGNATYSTSALTVGSHVIVAAYAGDATHFPAQQSLTQQVLSAYPTNTALSSSLNPALVNQSVTFTATVTPGVPSYGTPTGSVAFSDNGNTVTTVPLNASGVATWTTTTLPIGNHNITATYIPTTDYAASSASITQVINGLPDTTQLTAAPDPALALAPVTLTAIVTAAGGSPTGSVNFLDGAQVIGTAALNAAGVATFQASFATSGVHNLTAHYNGDATFAASTSAPFPETIQANASS